MSSGLWGSVLRTVVPIGAGLVVSLAGVMGLDVDTGQATAVVTSVVTAAYYTLLRLLEEWADSTGRPWLRRVAGVLLGWARPPQYPTPPPRDLSPALRQEARSG